MRLITTQALQCFAESAPNFFIGFRIDRPDVAYSVSQYLARLLYAYQRPEDREIVEEGFVQPSKHHIQLCVCTLKSDNEIERVKQVYML